MNRFNTNKFILHFKFGNKWSSETVVVNFNSFCLYWVVSLKYLGVVFPSLSLNCNEIKRKLYAACNSIAYSCKHPGVLIKLQLVKSYCLPLFTHCDDANGLPRN